jgi:anhydro-N-acetylmuramic acid kinase
MNQSDKPQNHDTAKTANPDSGKKMYEVIGMMSGTSLDGLDLAYCRFYEGWDYEILQAETIPYPDSWRNRLRDLDQKNALEFAQTDWDLGYYMGTICRDFMEKHQIHPLLVASHGQTIFHNPQQGYTVQIGQGAAIAAQTGCPVVCDFRSGDVALGGQGAPLVPIGDALLFGGYDACLNIGGFANISYQQSNVADQNQKPTDNQSPNQRIAYDIAPANMVLNWLANQLGKPYDDAGKMASEGKIIPGLLNQLNALSYYQQPPPKSLGKEWVEEHIVPIIKSGSQEVIKSGKSGGYEVRNLLATYTEHLAFQIAENVNKYRVNNLLVSGDEAAKIRVNKLLTPEDRAVKDRVIILLITGGGAYNDCLIERIRHYASADVVIPDKRTIDFKEALIFAFLGLLRWRNEVNTLASVTGASRNHIGGAVYL